MVYNLEHYSGSLFLRGGGILVRDVLIQSKMLQPSLSFFGGFGWERPTVSGSRRGVVLGGMGGNLGLSPFPKRVVDYPG